MGSEALYQHGPATYLEDRSRSVADRPHAAAVRRAAKEDLKFPAVRWSGREALSIVHGIEDAVIEGEYCIHALAVLPEHLHLVVAAHNRSPKLIAGHLKSRATRRLRQEHAWPSDRPVWGKRCWTTFLTTIEAVHAAVLYVEANPPRAGLKRQRWSVVTPLEG